MRRTARIISEPQRYNPFKALASFTRIMLTLGVLDRERREFWRFFTQPSSSIVKHLFTRLRLAAMGYHFRKLNNLYGEN